DRTGHLAGVGDREEDRVEALVDRLLDALGLDLPVFLRRRQPLDLNLRVATGGDVGGGLFRARPRGEEDRVVGALPDDRDANRAPRTRGRIRGAVPGGITSAARQPEYHRSSDER